MIKLKLKSLLGYMEITQKELSAKTGIRPNTISDICNNKTKELSISVIERICDVLDCDPSDWIKREK